MGVVGTVGKLVKNAIQRCFARSVTRWPSRSKVGGNPWVAGRRAPNLAYPWRSDRMQIADYEGFWIESMVARIRTCYISLESACNDQIKDDVADVARQVTASL